MSNVSRRQFLSTSAAVAGASYFAAHGWAAPRELSANDKINIASIGVGGQGNAITNSAATKHNLVAMCDVDEKRAGGNWEKQTKAAKFSDFRKMFDKLEKQIDAVAVSTPDHMHFHPAYYALTRDKHLYCEKPLAHNVWEVRTLTKLAADRKLATQLGNQRHANEGLRQGVELVKSGVLGDITEVHSWIGGKRGMPADLGAPTEPPKNLNWDLWLGCRPDRPYTDKLAPYDWRFWWEFGTGESGNWGCHILDIPYWALDLQYPTNVSGSGPAPDPLKTPTSMSTVLDFAATSARPALKLHWYHGVPAILAEKGLKTADVDHTKSMNNLFIGTKGMLLCGFDTGKYKLLPEDKFKDVKPSKALGKSPGFHQEWFDAIRGGTPATCNFAYSGPMAESVLLANIAYRVQGTFGWDGQAMKAQGNPGVDKYLREEYRKGWEV